MVICVRCGKTPHKLSRSKHQKGSSGASEWPLRAQITKRTQTPNLHAFKGQRYCTKCLRIVKKAFNQAMSAPTNVTPLRPLLDP